MPQRQIPPLLTAALLAALSISDSPALALGEDDPSALCLNAAKAAADRTGVPYAVLLAVSVVETGRNRRPWPWTVNLAGDGRWLDNAADAEAVVNAALEKGSTNIDIGCFQLNLRWHAKAFGSVADMLDPGQNAEYAADYLAKHFASTGDWALAAAAYHSATPEHADRYRARFEATFATLAGEQPSADPAIAEPRLNSFPLLVAGGMGLGGSIVPNLSGGQPLVGGP